MNIENELLATYTKAISDIPAEHHHLVEIAVQAAIHFTRLTTLRDALSVPEATINHAFTMSQILLDEFFYENCQKTTPAPQER